MKMAPVRPLTRSSGRSPRDARPAAGHVLGLIVAVAWVASAGAVWLVEPSETDRIRADFVVRMLDFVDWPDELPLSDSVATIGVVGDSPVVTALERRSGRRIGRRRLEVIRVSDSADMTPCRIVYVADATLEAGALSSLGARPVFTVGESPSFIEAGGMMRFFDEGGQVRFELSSDAAERSGLRLSSRVLELAEVAGTEAR